MAGVLLAFILLSDLAWANTYDPKGTLFVFKSGSSIPSTILAGLSVSEIPFSDGNLLSHFTEVKMRWIVISFVYLRKGTEWHRHLHLSFIVLIQRSTAGICSPAAHMSKVVPGNSSLITS